MAKLHLSTGRHTNGEFEILDYTNYNEVTSITEPYQRYQFILGDWYDVHAILDAEGDTVKGFGSNLDGLKIGDKVYNTYFRSNGPLIYHDEKSTELEIVKINVTVAVCIKDYQLLLNSMDIEFKKHNGETFNIRAFNKYEERRNILKTKHYRDKGCFFSTNKELTDKFYDEQRKKYDDKLPEIIASLPTLPKPKMYFKYFEGGSGRSGATMHFDAVVHRTNGMYADVELCMNIGEQGKGFVKINEKYKKGSGTWYPKEYQLNEIPEEYQWVVDKLKAKHWDDLLQETYVPETDKYCSFCGKEPKGMVSHYGYGAVICEDCRPYTVFYIGEQDREYETESFLSKYIKDITPFLDKCACGCNQNLLDGFDDLSGRTGATPNYDEFLGKKYHRGHVDTIVELEYRKRLGNKE
jgi:hypothetical protein